ncbi:uncharacterized protein [Macrobrachium rosenbergii]|uniref:uncharacterized protein n=1 Tax=Macrobrachium rosenbergii TaxID=79674 RepID=UPI0034D6906A
MSATVLLLLLRALCLAHAYDALAFHGNFGDRIVATDDGKTAEGQKPVERKSSSLPETLNAEKQGYSPVLGEIDHQTPHFLRESRQATVDKFEDSRILERNATFPPKIPRQSTRAGSNEGNATTRIPQAPGNRTQRVLFPDDAGKTRQRVVTLSQHSTRPNVPRTNRKKKKEKIGGETGVPGAGHRERHQLQRQVHRQKQRFRYRGAPEEGKSQNNGGGTGGKDGAVDEENFDSKKKIGPLRPCTNPVGGACGDNNDKEEAPNATSTSKPPEPGRNHHQQEKTVAPSHASSIKIIKLEPVELRPLPPTGSGNPPPFLLPGAPKGRDQSRESPTGERFIRHAHGGTGSGVQIVSVTPWSVFHDPIQLPPDLISGGVPKAPVIEPVQLDTRNFLTTAGPLSSHRLEEWLQETTDVKQRFPADEGLAAGGDSRVVYGSFTLPAAAIAAQTITEANSIVQGPPKETRTQEGSQGRREILTKETSSQNNPAPISSTSESPPKDSKGPFESLQQGVREFLLRQRKTNLKGGHSLTPTQDEGLHKHLFEATQDIIEKAQLEERRKELFSTVRSTPIVHQNIWDTNDTLSAREDQGHVSSAQEVITSANDPGITRSLEDNGSADPSPHPHSVSTGQDEFLSQEHAVKKDHEIGLAPNATHFHPHSISTGQDEFLSQEHAVRKDHEIGLAPNTTQAVQASGNGFTREYMMDRAKTHQTSGFRDAFRSPSEHAPFPRVLTPPRLSPASDQRPSLAGNIRDRFPPVRATLQPYFFNPFHNFLRGHGISDEMLVENHNNTHILNTHAGFEALTHSDALQKGPESASDFFIIEPDSLPASNERTLRFNVSRYQGFQEPQGNTQDFSFGEKESKGQHQMVHAGNLAVHHPQHNPQHNSQHNTPSLDQKEFVDLVNHSNWSSDNEQPIVTVNTDQSRRFRASYKKAHDGGTSQSSPDSSTSGEPVSLANQRPKTTTTELPLIDRREQESASLQHPVETHSLPLNSFERQVRPDDSHSRKDVLKSSFPGFPDSLRDLERKEPKLNQNQEFKGHQGTLNLPASIVPVPPPYYPPTKPPSEMAPPPHIAPATPPPDRLPPMRPLDLPFNERLPELFEGGASGAKDTGKESYAQEDSRKDDSFIDSNNFHGLINFELRKDNKAFQPDNLGINASPGDPNIPLHFQGQNLNLNKPGVENRPFPNLHQKEPSAVAIVLPANIHPPDHDFTAFQKEIAALPYALHNQNSPPTNLAPQPSNRFPESGNSFSILPTSVSPDQLHATGNEEHTEENSEEVDDRFNEVGYPDIPEENFRSHEPRTRSHNANEIARKPPVPQHHKPQFTPQSIPHFPPGNRRPQFNQGNRGSHFNRQEKQPLRQPPGNFFPQGQHNLRQIPQHRPLPLHAVYVKPPPNHLTAPPGNLKRPNFVNFDIPASGNLVDSDDDEILSFSESVSSQHTGPNAFGKSPLNGVAAKDKNNLSKPPSPFPETLNSFNLADFPHITPAVLHVGGPPIYYPATSSVSSFSHPPGVSFPSSQSPHVRNPPVFQETRRPLLPPSPPPLPPPPPPPPLPPPPPSLHPRRPLPSRLPPAPTFNRIRTTLHPPSGPLPRFPSSHEMESDFRPLGGVSQPLPDDPRSRDIRLSESHARLIQNMQYGIDGRPLDVWIPIVDEDDDDGGYDTKRSIQVSRKTADERSNTSLLGTSVTEGGSYNSPNEASSKSDGGPDPHLLEADLSHDHQQQEDGFGNEEPVSEVVFGAKTRLDGGSRDNKEVKTSGLVPPILIPREAPFAWG